MANINMSMPHTNVKLGVSQIGAVIHKDTDITEPDLLCHYKGNVADITRLPLDAKLGDVYNVISTGTNYIWSGSFWDAQYEQDYELADNFDIERMFI